MINYLVIASLLALCFSIFLNLVLFVQIKTKKRRPPNQELREFIHELTSDGGAIAAFSPEGRVTKIDTTDFLMRAPKR